MNNNYIQTRCSCGNPLDLQTAKQIDGWLYACDECFNYHKTCHCPECEQERKIGLSKGLEENPIDWDGEPERWADHWRNRASKLSCENMALRICLRELEKKARESENE